MLIDPGLGLYGLAGCVKHRKAFLTLHTTLAIACWLTFLKGAVMDQYMFMIVCGLIMLVSDIIIWLRVIRLPSKQRWGQMFSAVILLISAVGFLAFGLTYVG